MPRPPKLWIALGGYVSMSTYTIQGYWAINIMIGKRMFSFSVTRTDDET